MNKRQLELSTVIASPPEHERLVADVEAEVDGVCFQLFRVSIEGDEPIVEFTSLGALGQRVLAFSATDVAAALSRATSELTRMYGQ